MISFNLNGMIADGKINNITYPGKKSFRIPSQLGDLLENDTDSSIQQDADLEAEADWPVGCPKRKSLWEHGNNMCDLKFQR